MKMFWVLTALLASIAIAQAASSQRSPGGLDFSCNINTKKCYCEGVPEGADCQAMKKNCSGAITDCADPAFPTNPLIRKTCCTMALTSGGGCEDRAKTVYRSQMDRCNANDSACAGKAESRYNRALAKCSVTSTRPDSRAPATNER